MANQQKYCIGEKNFGESPTWEIKQKFKLHDASGGPGVNFGESRCARILKQLAKECREQWLPNVTVTVHIRPWPLVNSLMNVQYTRSL